MSIEYFLDIVLRRFFGGAAKIVSVGNVDDDDVDDGNGIDGASVDSHSTSEESGFKFK